MPLQLIQGSGYPSRHPVFAARRTAAVASNPPLVYEELLTPAEVARLFGVDSKTITNWAASGKIPRDAVTRTPGGVRRYRASVMYDLRNAGAPA